MKQNCLAAFLISVGLFTICSVSPVTGTPATRQMGDSQTATDDKVWKKLIDDEHKAEAAKNYKQAEMLAHKAVTAAEHFDKNDERLAESLKTLGDAIFNSKPEQKKLEEARVAYQTAIQIYKMHRQLSDPKVQYLVSQLYRIMGEQNDAAHLEKVKQQVYQMMKEKRAARKLAKPRPE
ncbi:MAG TPA: hypothetical protein V6C72_09455 [Chroococcales cyanobacterium]